MAFGREGGGRMGVDTGLYASRQDSNSSSGTTPHWMKQLEEKYQRLHAKIVNQAAKFSNARFNAINNNINHHHRNLSYGGIHRNSSVSKSCTDGVNSVLSKRGSSLSSSAAFHSKRELPDETGANNGLNKGWKTGTKRRSNVENPSPENRAVDSFLVSDESNEVVIGGAGGSAQCGGKRNGLVYSSGPPPHGSNDINPKSGDPTRQEGMPPATRGINQAETCDPVRATLAKTSAAIALLNSAPIKDGPLRARRRGKGGYSGSRLHSTHRPGLGQVPPETQQAEESRLAESVYSIPAGTNSSGGYNKSHSNNAVICFEKEVSAGVSTQLTPRASKPTTRASSSQALTRLSSANFVSVSTAQSILREDLENKNCASDADRRETNAFFTKTQDPLLSNFHRISHNGDVNGRRCDENQGIREDEFVAFEDFSGEYYSCEDDSEYSLDNEEDVFLDEEDSEGEEFLGQSTAMEVAKSKGRRHATRTAVRPSVSRVGQKPHKSCPAYFWKSANPNADSDDGEVDKDHGRISKQTEKTDKGQVNLRKKKNNMRKRDRRSTKSHEVRKGNITTGTISNNDNNINIAKDNPNIDGHDNRKETQLLDESNDGMVETSPYKQQSMHDNNNDNQQHHHKPRSDSKGTISPVQGTLLPLTARAVEEGRMRVFARMSLEARHAVDETLREMEREEEKMDKEKAVDKNVDGDSQKHGNMEMESTWDVSVVNHTSGTRGHSRVLEGDMTEGGNNQDRSRGGENGVGKEGDRDNAAGSQGSVTSDNFQDDFYASGKFHHNSNSNFLHAKHPQDFTHSPGSSTTAHKRGGGHRAGSRRLPHLSDLPSPAQTSSLPNPHARLPGIASKSRLPLSYRETTFEITPPDFDIRFHHIISCQSEGRETPPPDVRQQSIDKCQQWLVRHNPR
ncbi:hypothetical protein EGW08_000103 [Elysia chlorotica]|uniref:Uncharacterized protein n=1 Tax=Elysia chlorotica TaxID=188477 RepID=A0A3S1BN72_ELYCH|nr:hypothetical protein EGW08_000103 [Elysia chlorotica]